MKLFIKLSFLLVTICTSVASVATQNTSDDHKTEITASDIVDEDDTSTKYRLRIDTLNPSYIELGSKSQRAAIVDHKSKC